MVRSESSRVYLLHRRPFKESSAILDCFSQESGRISLVARLGGKQKTLTKGLLQPFTPLQIQFSGRSSLKNLRHCEPVSVAIPLQGESLYCGLYLNELLYYLLQLESPQPELYALYQTSLIALAQSEIQCEFSRRKREQILRCFEFSLLKILGYELQLDRCNGSVVKSTGYYQYLVGQGLIEVSGQSEASGSTLCLRGELLLAMAQGDFALPTVLAAAKQITRMTLAALLNGRELKSRKLFQ